MIALFLLSARAAILSALLWCQRNWRIVLGGFLALVAVFLLLGYCRKADAPKLDQKQIIEAQTAIAQQDEAKMREILIESDARGKVAEQTAINAKAETVNAIQESKERWKDAEAEEMAAELERRANQ